MKSPSEVDDAKYNEFYKFIAKAYDTPLAKVRPTRAHARRALSPNRHSAGHKPPGLFERVFYLLACPVPGHKLMCLFNACASERLTRLVGGIRFFRPLASRYPTNNIGWTDGGNACVYTCESLPESLVGRESCA